jgi:hypothetical protein
METASPSSNAERKMSPAPLVKIASINAMELMKAPFASNGRKEPPLSIASVRLSPLRNLPPIAQNNASSKQILSLYASQKRLAIGEPFFVTPILW